MKTRLKIKKSLLIYEDRRRTIGFLSKFPIYLFSIVLFLALPIFMNVNPYERLLDTSFSKDLSLKISLLKREEVNFLLKNLLNTNISSLIEMTVKDGKLDERDKNLLILSNSKYGSNKLKEAQARFLYELKVIPDFKRFFKENIKLKYLSEIKFEEDLLSEVEVEIYKLNSDKIPILMYHMLDYPYRWIDKKTFKSHLEKLYDAGFTTISVNDFLKNDFSSVQDGKKPIILTFDDAFESQFRILKNGSIDPETGVGMLEENYKLHPNFGRKAAFFIFLSKYPFGQANQPKLWFKKVNYLYDNEYDIGCHTYSHVNLSMVPAERISRELNAFYTEMEEIFGEKFKKSMLLAYPDGDLLDNMKIIENYAYKRYSFDACFSAWGWLAPLPVSPEFNRYKIPRIEANNESIEEILKAQTFKKETIKIKLLKIYITNDQLFKEYINEKEEVPPGNFFYKNLKFSISSKVKTPNK